MKIHNPLFKFLIDAKDSIESSIRNKLKPIFEEALKEGNILNFSLQVFYACLWVGISPQELLGHVATSDTTKYSSKTRKFDPSKALIARQTELTKLLINKGANLDVIKTFSVNFVKIICN